MVEGEGRGCASVGGVGGVCSSRAAAAIALCDVQAAEPAPAAAANQSQPPQTNTTLVMFSVGQGLVQQDAAHSRHVGVLCGVPHSARTAGPEVELPWGLHG